MTPSPILTRARTLMTWAVYFFGFAVLCAGLTSSLAYLLPGLLAVAFFISGLAHCLAHFIAQQPLMAKIAELPSMRTTRLWGARLTNAVASVAVGLFVLLAADITLGPWLAFRGATFDAQKWHAAGLPSKLMTSCPRGAMVYDLTSSVLKPGTSRERVRELLGPGGADPADRVLDYPLGFCTSSWDLDVLHVFFDEHGKLTRTEIVNH